MKKIVHLALRTGFSFKNVYGHLDETLKYGYETGYIGVADLASTHSHPMIEQRLNDFSSYKVAASQFGREKIENIKPIYSVRLTVVKDATERVKPRGQFGCEYIFIAKTADGLSEIYNLVRIFYENFYYRGNISLKDVYKLSKNVIVIAENFDKKKRIDYIALTTTTPKMFKEYKGIPKVAIINNFFPTPADRDVYEIFTYKNNCHQTYPQHILSTEEWFELYKKNPEAEDAINNTHKIAKKCCNIKLKKADLVKYKGPEKIEFLCKLGARKLGIDIKNKGKYKSRYDKEIKLILEKGYQDYFLIVAEMIKKAKVKMLVGPGRGSSGGSLVCYLMGITECLDPIKFGLLFERFIDINRSDLPDIDIDFPDTKRELVIKQLLAQYGTEKVRQIANISTMKPKIAIGEFAKSLGIPEYETESIKTAIIERSGGDARAAMRMIDTFETTEIGKEFIEKYPAMKEVSKIENHPRHSSVHAAGVIVCNNPIENFAGINTRDGTAMVDRKTSEYLNLLKIDILGLRTLSILEECASLIGMDFKEYYSLPLDSEKTFEIFNDMRLAGIFQFEGYSLTQLTKKMGIHSFEDITAITSLARPGALYSGGARRYIQYRIGEETPVFYGKLHKKITKDTFGIVVYQEQILKICRKIGNMNWSDVNALRKALSKSMGKEYFNRYKEKFVKGAAKNGYDEDESEFLWGEIENGGAYAFNRSHAVAYAIISYWCAYIKARYPKEFLVANLNHAKSDDSAVKLLRDMVLHENAEYVSIDPDESLKKWSINSKGMIVGGLLNIHGVGAVAANKIIKSRATGEKLPAGIIKKLLEPVTPYDIIFPTQHYWGDLYDSPRKYGLGAAPDKIIDVQEKGKFLIIGKLMFKNVRDLNDYVNLQKRNGQVYTSNSLMLSIKVEDDTDSIMVNIDRFSFEEKGRQIAETGTVEEDWYLIKGEIKWEGRYLVAQEIMKLDESIIERS